MGLVHVHPAAVSSMVVTVELCCSVAACNVTLPYASYDVCTANVTVRCWLAAFALSVKAYSPLVVLLLLLSVAFG